MKKLSRLAVMLALVLALYWGATLLYLPATILTILAFGFWLPVTIALMIVYPGLEKVFKLEETINARRAAEKLERGDRTPMIPSSQRYAPKNWLQRRRAERQQAA